MLSQFKQPLISVIVITLAAYLTFNLLLFFTAAHLPSTNNNIPEEQNLQTVTNQNIPSNWIKFQSDDQKLSFYHPPSWQLNPALPSYFKENFSGITQSWMFSDQNLTDLSQNPDYVNQLVSIEVALIHPQAIEQLDLLTDCYHNALACQTKQYNQIEFFLIDLPTQTQSQTKLILAQKPNSALGIIINVPNQGNPEIFQNLDAFLQNIDFLL